MFDLSLHDSLLIIVSVLVTAGCFNIALYFGYHRKPTYLFFAFYCLFHVFKIWLKTYEADEVLVGSLGLTAFDLIYLSVLAGMISLNTFISLHFSLPHGQSTMLGFSAVSLIFFFWLPEMNYIQLALAVALAQTIYGIRKEKSGYILLTGLVVFAIFIQLGVADIVSYGYFVGIILFVFSMMLASGIELASRNKRFQEALLRSSRLENQLLKKNIQPHFILNSLTSLQELIDSEPEKASDFVYHLGREFELFAKISDQKLISVFDELGLIESYLKVMSIRKSADFSLKSEDIREEDQIPPGVLLTLVENGISHGYEHKDHGRFTLKKIENERYCEYTLRNDGHGVNTNKPPGMGLQYVHARLEESYATNFEFESKPENNGWVSRIRIMK